MSAPVWLMAKLTWNEVNGETGLGAPGVPSVIVPLLAPDASMIFTWLPAVSASVEPPQLVVKAPPSTLYSMSVPFWAKTSEVSLVPAVCRAVPTPAATLNVNAGTTRPSNSSTVERRRLRWARRDEEAERKKAFGVTGRDRMTDMIRVSRCGLELRCGSMPATERGSSARASHENKWTRAPIVRSARTKIAQGQGL